MTDRRWESEIEQLRRDNRSGAEEIANRALELLIDAIGDSLPDGAISYRRWLLHIGREIVAAQPSMGGLFRLVNNMLWACHGAMGGEQIRQNALAFLQEYRARVGSDLETLAQIAADYLAKYPVIMTYSRSATVLRALTTMAGHEQIRVLCSEGRPMFEGQTLASELGWAGIEVTVGIDMALFGWLPQTEALVLGADSLSDSGLVNKIGTAQLVRAAVERDIPRIVLCTSQKFLPSDYLIEQNLRVGDAEQIMPASENVTVSNTYFDITPLDLISVVITEKGPLVGGRLTEELARIRTYPGLREVGA